jgi:hypothetical protein
LRGAKGGGGGDGGNGALPTVRWAGVNVEFFVTTGAGFGAGSATDLCFGWALAANSKKQQDNINNNFFIE